MEIRNGDVVLIRATVNDSEPMFGDVVYVQLHEGFTTQMVDRSIIVSVEVSAIKVGDMVTCGLFSSAYEVRAIIDDYAMLRDRHGLIIQPIANLKLVPMA